MPRKLPRDPETLRALAAQYREGASIRQVASGHGWSFGGTRSVLAEAQSAGFMTIRPRGTRSRISGTASS